MHIQELGDGVAERLDLDQEQEQEQEQQQEQEQEKPQVHGPAPAPQAEEEAFKPVTAGMFPELSPGRATTGKKTVDEVVAELKRTPFFMTELEENDETEAFKALAYEGTPLENAAEFKEQGNECYKLRRWVDAKEFYTKGILILAAEERKRKVAAAAAAAGPSPQELVVEEKGPGEGEEKEKEKKKKKEEEATSEDEIRRERETLESLYSNRSACHLELGNNRSCWLDAAAALRLNEQNIKAYYRSTRAFLAVDRIAEADDACARGLALDPSNKSLQAVARDVIRRAEELDVRQKREAERRAKEKRRELLVRAALRARGIRTRATAQPPEMEDAAVKLVPDPDDPASSLAFPTVLLYPAHLQSDFVKAFDETETLADHLAYVFPLPWDREGAYTLAGVECYIETAAGGLIKFGKKVPLLKVLAGGKVEVVDEVVRIFVLPKAQAAAWVEEFKAKRAAQKGGS
ncbi:TPR-like protein [Xylaria sp. CBS 124048]|nr:TPR-like protein [Xylaria sp. CBS 124048]